jgi:23S rRNA (guanosine2251-2'-O)-methyltransferase
VIAVCSPKPRLSIEELNDVLQPLTVPPLLLVIEGVEDARNLGFVLRTAEAMGVHCVMIKKHLWDLDTIEIARPASGAYERMPLVQIDSVAPLKKLQSSRGMQLIGCLAGARRTIYDVDLREPTILALGGEKRGLSGAIREICNHFVTIPTVGGASSLSLSHAAAIVTAEAYRQRRPVPEVTP